MSEISEEHARSNAMLAGMEGLIAAMKARRPSPHPVDLGGSSTMVPSEKAEADVLVAAPWNVMDTDESAHVGALACRSVVGRYVVRQKLGAGGMGVIYAAYDPELDRDVALKLLRRGVSGPSARTRLLREAQTLGKLSHPNVVTILDVGIEGEQVWLAMELVRGCTLSQWLAQRRGWYEVLEVMLEAGRGLVAAHAAGLLHRDFKPDNVMVGDDGRVRVMDFGLACLRPNATLAPEDRPVSPTIDALALRVTRTDALLGTPSYMAPEQFDGVLLTAAADQFSFCVALWEALYGEQPFSGSTWMELAANVIGGRLRAPPKSRNVPRWLRRACARGLSASSNQRWPSMEVLLDTLARGLAHARKRSSTTVNTAWRDVDSIEHVARTGASRLSLFGLGAVAVLAILPLVSTPDPCSGAAEPLATVWNDEVRVRTREAVLATPVSHAERTWSRVEAGLDELGTAWTDTRVSVCRALGAEALATAEDPQVQCLDRRLAELGAFVELLEQPDPKLLDRAVMALPDPTAITTCETLEPTEPPLPPDQAAAIAKAQQEIDVIRVWLRADRIDEVLARARALRLEVEGIDHPALQARARSVLGEALMHRNEIDAAGAELEAGYELALGHDDALAARLAARLAHLRGYRQSRLDEGRTWQRHAEAALERAPPDPVVTAYVEREVAVLLDTSGESEAALERLEHALERLEAHYGPTHAQLLSVLSSLAVVQQRLGRLEAAVATHERTLALKRAELGNDHPSIVHTLTNLGVALSGLDRLDEALAMMTEALERQRADPHVDPLALALTESSLGIILLRLERVAEAQAASERAVEASGAWTEERHPDAALILIGLGNAAKERGDLELAKRAFARSLTIQEVLLEPQQLASQLVVADLAYEDLMGLHDLAQPLSDLDVPAWVHDLSQDPGIEHEPHGRGDPESVSRRRVRGSRSSMLQSGSGTSGSRAHRCNMDLTRAACSARSSSGVNACMARSLTPQPR